MIFIDIVFDIVLIIYDKLSIKSHVQGLIAIE